MRTALLLGLGLGACGEGGGPPPPDGTASEHWAERAPLPTSLQETAAVALDGQLYVIGGLRAQTIASTVHRYDVAADAWAAAPALPAAVHHGNAVVDGETLYVLGNLQTTDFLAAPSVWSYRPASDDVWQIHPPMPRARGSSVVGAIDGVLYVAGGLVGGRATDQVDAYDPALQTWTARAPLPASVDHACGGVIDGILYVAGGRDTSPDAPTSRAYAYTPAADAWTTVASMPTGRGGTACGVVGGRLIVVGGEGNDDSPRGVFPEVEAYDPTTDAWETLEPMLHPRHGMGAAVWDGRLYVPGGANVQLFGAVATHDVFTP